MRAPVCISEAPVVPRYLSPKQAAVYTGIAVKTLEALRLRGDGPPFSKVGWRVVYDTHDLDAYMAARRVRSVAEGHVLNGKGVARA